MNISNENYHDFLKMQESPEDYTDEQLEAMMDSMDMVPNVEEEWTKFEAAHLHGDNSSRSYVWMKKAASVIVAILLMGIAYAASVATGIMPNVFSAHNESGQLEETLSHIQTSTSKPQTLTTSKPLVLFDNVTLGDITSEFSTYYNIKVEFKDTKVKDVRLYFNWDKSASLEDNIAVLNAFEKINICLKDNTLIIE